MPEPEYLPAVSVLVSSKDRRPLLRQAVASLRKLDYPQDKLEIVVVEETDSPEDPGADRYVALPRSGKGFAWSRNHAFRAASHSIVAFTDDDVIVDPRWLRELVSPFRDPDVGAVAGGVLAQPSGIVGKTEIVLGFPGGGLKRIARARGSETMPTKNLSTVNAATRRELLEELGGFCEATGVYGGEDSELFSRLTARAQAVFNPRALVYHLARDSFPRVSQWLYRRGIAAVALLKLDERRRRGLVLEAVRGSLLLRFGLVVGVVSLLPISLSPVLVALLLAFYAVQLVRLRFARRPMGLSVWLLAPMTKLVMDVSFELGRLRGVLMWLGGGFEPSAPLVAASRSATESGEVSR